MSVKIGVIFGVRFEKRNVDIKANLHENWNMQTLFWSLLSTFCQISSKSIFVILSYTVLKLVHFWDTVYIQYPRKSDMSRFIIAVTVRVFISI